MIPDVSQGPPAAPTARDRQLMDKAKELETAFLAEMLKYAGMDDSGGGFFGSAGEGQFGSFLREAEAARMVEKGGIGLAETLFKSLARMEDGQG